MAPAWVGSCRQAWPWRRADGAAADPARRPVRPLRARGRGPVAAEDAGPSRQRGPFPLEPGPVTAADRRAVTGGGAPPRAGGAGPFVPRKRTNSPPPRREGLSVAARAEGVARVCSRQWHFLFPPLHPPSPSGAPGPVPPQQACLPPCRQASPAERGPGRDDPEPVRRPPRRSEAGRAADSDSGRTPSRPGPGSAGRRTLSHSARVRLAGGPTGGPAAVRPSHWSGSLARAAPAREARHSSYASGITRHGDS